MNKQELIKAVIELPVDCSGSRPKIDKLTTLELIKLLKEPEKVQIPKFVTDWIEVCKEHLTTSLYTAMNSNFMRENNQSFDLISWIKKTSNQELFARAWLDGYEVEKEKRYLVKVVGMDSVNGYLSYNKNLDKWFFGIASESKPYRAHHTRTELEEAGFGWVFDCEGVEIEEVE